MARLGKRVYKKALFLLLLSALHPMKVFLFILFFFDMGHDVSDIKIFQIGVVIHDIQFTNFYSRIQFC